MRPTNRKYKFVGILGKSKYYVTEDGWMARATRKKFIELGYIDDNWDKWVKLCEGI